MCFSDRETLHLHGNKNSELVWSEKSSSILPEKKDNTVQLAEKMTLNKLVWNVLIVYFCFWDVKCSINANKLNFLKSKLLFKCSREVWLRQNVSEVKGCLSSRLLVGYTFYRENSLTKQEIRAQGLILLCFWISVSSSAKWGVKIYKFPITPITNYTNVVV